LTFPSKWCPDVKGEDIKCAHHPEHFGRK